MRPTNSPPVSPFLAPDRPQIDQDAFSSSQPQIAEVDLPGLPDPNVDDNPMNDYQSSPSSPLSSSSPSSPSYEPTTSAAHAHTNLHSDSAQVFEDSDDAGTSDPGTNHEMLDVDVEEGGAPLNDINMEDPDDQGHVIAPVDYALINQPGIPIQPPPPINLDFIAIQPSQTLISVPEAQDPPEDDMDAVANTGLHPMALSNANPVSLGPENPHVMQFLELWEWQSNADAQLRANGPVPSSQQISRLARECPRRVDYKQLRGDLYDFQGISWRDLGITRNMARCRRMATFHNYVNRPNSDSLHTDSPDRLLRPVENYFRYKSMDIRRDVRLLHFQLRNILGVASRTRAFYPSFTTIKEHDPTTGRDKVAMRFDSQTGSHISTLAATEDVLIAGGFYGTYRYRHLNSSGDLEAHEGLLTNHNSGITNHVQIHPSRHSSTPLAAFASNDYGFRVVDLSRNKVISGIMYGSAMNCSALSPDMRLRVIVGDDQNVLIADAESGEILQSLEGHRDFGFACDWAPDGWTVATGNQDRSIRIWDARKWKNSKGESTSVAVVRTEMAGARSLRFSPLGSGKRILVAAEDADFINLIDAQTFNTKQTVDIFGELGGVAFANGGQDLIALSCDLSRGGIMRLERCDAGAEDNFSYAHRKYREPSHWWRTPGYDWMQSPEQVVAAPGSQQSLTHKRRHAAMSEDWTF